MRFIILLFFLSLAVNCAQAQDIDKMTYGEIDSMFQEILMAGDLSSGIEIAKKGLKRAEREKQDSFKVVMLNALGYLYTMSGDIQQAQSTIDQAIDYSERVLGKEHVEYASSLNSLATLFYQQGKYQESIALFEKVCEIIARVAGKDHDYYAAGVQNLALLLERLGRLEEAEYYYMESKALLEKNNQTNTPIYSLMMGNLGSLYEVMGQEKQAEQLYVGILEELEKKQKGPQYIMNLNNLGGLYKNTQRYKEAIKLFEEAQSLAVETLGEKHQTYGTILTNLANTYELVDDFEKAEKIHKTSISIAKESKDQVNYAFSLKSLGSAYIKMEEYEKAEKYLSQALEITEKAFGKNHYRYTFTLYHLANLHRLAKNYSKAYDRLHQAINITVSLDLGTEIPESWADSIYNVGQLDYQNFDNLLYFFSEYIFLLRADRPNDQQTMTVIADLALRLIQRAKQEFHEEEDKLRVAGRQSNWIHVNLMLMNLDEQEEKALELAEQDKASLLLEATRSQRAYNFGGIPDSTAKKEKELNKALAQIQVKILESTDQAKKEQYRKLYNDRSIEVRKFKEKIKTDYPKYAKFKYEQEGLDLQLLQADLDANMAILEYVVTSKYLYIFYIDQQQVEILQQIIDPANLKDQIQEFHGMLSNYSAATEEDNQQLQNYVQKAHWFYQQMIEPVEGLLKGKKQLLIIPDRELGHLPFESFLVEVPEDQSVVDFLDLHYLLNDFAISYDYSINLWQQNLKRVEKGNGKIFAVAANYEQEEGQNRGVDRLPIYRNMRDHLQALPAAREEVEQLSKRYKGKFIFDTNASERNFKEQAKEYSIIHLAMHGLLNESEPILSSLAFTEDGDAVENNFLQAYEISKMDLDASLVVLSACETGYGRFERGNGIASLARSFMYAGTPALVVTLWQVNDVSTSAIMQDFYLHLEKGLNKAEALQQAKLNYLKTFGAKTPRAAHPAFWAPFIQIGNSNPVNIASKQIGSVWLWSLVILPILGILLLIFAWRNRSRIRSVRESNSSSSPD